MIVTVPSETFGEAVRRESHLTVVEASGAPAIAIFSTKSLLATPVPVIGCVVVGCPVKSQSHEMVSSSSRVASPS